MPSVVIDLKLVGASTDLEHLVFSTKKSGRRGSHVAAIDERTIAIQDSQKARLEKPRLGMSGAPLGESVARNLRARRVKITESDLADAWDASRVDNQPWVISVTFSYRGREQRANWRYNPHTRE